MSRRSMDRRHFRVLALLCMILSQELATPAVRVAFSSIRDTPELHGIHGLRSGQRVQVMGSQTTGWILHFYEGSKRASLLSDVCSGGKRGMSTYPISLLEPEGFQEGGRVMIRFNGRVLRGKIVQFKKKNGKAMVRLEGPSSDGTEQVLPFNVINLEDDVDTCQRVTTIKAEKIVAGQIVGLYGEQVRVQLKGELKMYDIQELSLQEKTVPPCYSEKSVQPKPEELWGPVKKGVGNISCSLIDFGHIIAAAAKNPQHCTELYSCDLVAARNFLGKAKRTQFPNFMQPVMERFGMKDLKDLWMGITTMHFVLNGFVECCATFWRFPEDQQRECLGQHIRLAGNKLTVEFLHKVFTYGVKAALQAALCAVGVPLPVEPIIGFVSGLTGVIDGWVGDKMIENTAFGVGYANFRLKVLGEQNDTLSRNNLPAVLQDAMAELDDLPVLDEHSPLM